MIAEVACAVQRLDVFTLNHDTHIEDELKSAGYDCDAGFKDRKRGQFRVYQPGWAKNGVRKRVRIFKLHGSLNWYLCRFPRWAQQYAIPLVDPFRGLDARGRHVKAVEGKAAFLSGTIVKELHYGEGFFSDLFEDFRAHLSQHTHVIFCGYGFGDSGVNLRLDQWAHNLTGRKKKNT